MKYAIGGGVAAIVHGANRLPKDVDITVELPSLQIPSFVAALLPDYAIDGYAVSSAIATGTAFNIVSLPTGCKIDVFPLGRQPFQKECLANAQLTIIDPDQQTYQFYVLTREDIVVQKLLWYTTSPSDLQWDDVQQVLKATSDKPNKMYLGKKAFELGISELMVRALRAAQS
jgi:hypothetical protein